MSMRKIRELLRLILDSYAEALTDVPAESPLTAALRCAEELEHTVREQTRTIERLNDELYILKNARNSKKPGRLIKKLFTF